MKLTQAELTIDLGAIAANWAWMRSQIDASCDCGAVVKADAYGLGVAEVAPALANAGCRSFYVSTLEEGLALQKVLNPFKEYRIFVLTGCAHGQEQIFIESKLIPVIISLEMFFRWLGVCQKIVGKSSSLCAAIKVDTGMGRLGLGQDEFEKLLTSGRDLSKAGVKFLFSHLACADTPEHPLNQKQLLSLQRALEQLSSLIPGLKASFSNSAGVLLGKDFHFDFVRPGIALYGGQPVVDKHFSLRTVLSLILPVIQVRHLPAGESVGYGATRSWDNPRVIAVAKSGYADGLLRSLSNTGSAVLYHSQQAEGLPLVEVPMVGRVSMDTILFDVTAAGRDVVPGDGIEVLGKNKSFESLAVQANSINYEILTSLGGRYTRKYLRGVN